MKIINKILKIISTIVFAFLCLLVILILVYVGRIAYLTSQNRIGEIRINLYTILTQSMHPKIKAGDIIVTYRNDDNKYKKGDVITFVSSSEVTGGVTITHRIKKVVKQDGILFYETKGDNNNAADASYVPASNVFGKVIVTIPKMGTLQQFLVTKTGWVVAIVLPSLAIIIYDILKMFKAVVPKKKIKDDRYVIASQEDLNNIDFGSDQSLPFYQDSLALSANNDNNGETKIFAPTDFQDVNVNNLDLPVFENNNEEQQLAETSNNIEIEQQIENDNVLENVPIENNNNTEKSQIEVNETLDEPLIENSINIEENISNLDESEVIEELNEEDIEELDTNDDIELL